jgi:dCTP deaminase
MILTGNKIKQLVASKKVIIKPFNMKQCTTNSYDLTLGDSYLVYTDKILDPKKKPNYVIKKISIHGLQLKKGDFILCHSKEIIGSNHFVPIIHAKSGIARQGLFVHITADLIDIGSIGNVTFQLYATLPIRIYPNMKIGQVTFWKPFGKIKLYSGKYQGSIGPAPSQIWKDFQR